MEFKGATVAGQLILAVPVLSFLGLAGIPLFFNPLKYLLASLLCLHHPCLLCLLSIYASSLGTALRCGLMLCLGCTPTSLYFGMCSYRQQQGLLVHDVALDDFVAQGLPGAYMLFCNRTGLTKITGDQRLFAIESPLHRFYKTLLFFPALGFLLCLDTGT